VKKIIIFSLCLLALALPNWRGNRWEDEKYFFSFEIPGSWQIDPASRRRVYTNRGDGVTEFYVEVAPARKKDAPGPRTAEDVARDSLKGYDSWRYVAGRSLDGAERKGADSAFSVMFNRSMLQRAAARTVQVIAQEGYFVKGDHAITITLVTDSDTWTSAKKELLNIWNSFRVQ
jgi:hypothetical protein